MAKAEINKDRPSNPMMEIVVDDYLYKFSVQMLSTHEQEWLMGILSRHMQNIHDRAVTKTKTNFRTTLRELIGL